MVAADTDVIIVGGGHNGLVAATYLARAGLRVQLFERRSFVGGASITEELWPGFRFSTCAHMTHGIHPKIIRDLCLYERGMEAIARPFSLTLRDDGTYWGPVDHDSPRNLAFAGRLGARDRRELKSYGEFVSRLGAIFTTYRLGPPPTLEEVRSKVADTLTAPILERALSTRIWELHDACFTSNSLKERHASALAAVGRDPLVLSLAYSSLNAPEEGTNEVPPQGYIRGGMGTVTQLMREAAEEAGVTLNIGTAVDRFIVAGNRATGVRLVDGSEVSGRVVVSNLDPKRTFLQLLPAEHLAASLRKRINGLVTHVSCYKFLAVISELPRWRAWDGDPLLPSQGVVGLAKSRSAVKAAYDDVDAGSPPQVPLINFSVPSTLDASLTQPGYHTASLWIYPAPAKLRDASWDDVRDDVVERLIAQITEYAPNFRDSIQRFRFRTPLDLERENGLTDGCIWHIQHGGEQLFWNRPLPELAAYRAPVQGLYLCGAGQHPGGEVSGVPGHNAAHEVLKDLS